MQPKALLTKYTLSIAIIWLFHVSGILGLLYGYSKWFVGATPLNLSLCFGLLMYTSWGVPRLNTAIVLIFSVGMLAEILGVNYGLIFGHYQYGEALGPKLMGVPWLIGANWCILVVCSGTIAQELFDTVWARVLTGVGLMLLLDVLIEPIAPVLDFWEFNTGVAPLQNYLGWFCVALPLHVFFQMQGIKIKGWFTHHLFLLQLLFFTLLLLQINTLQNAL